MKFKGVCWQCVYSMVCLITVCGRQTQLSCWYQAVPSTLAIFPSAELDIALHSPAGGPGLFQTKRTPYSGMLRRVIHVRTDVSEERIVSIMRVTRIGDLGTTLAVTSHRFTLRRNNSHRRENLKSHFQTKFILLMHMNKSQLMLICIRKWSA
jgi:hypothetical protein